ncbi:MAG TPA: hypothetical protein ENI69_04770, partial [Rhodospirillales bacterium]|nr:hypothetical protein [Rhodospirillales bacterium]
MTSRSYDIYFGEALCGTAWARSVQGDDEETFCIEARTKFNDVQEIGLNRARTKARYIFSKDGKPRRIDISGDRGASVEINISDNALNYGKRDIPLDRPIDFALGGNMVPLLAIWWKEFKANQPGTFRTLIPETGTVIDYILEFKGNTLRSSLGETFILDGEGEISEVKPDASDFVIRRGNRPFPKWNFKRHPEQSDYRPPVDLNTQDVEIEDDGKIIEATVARPLNDTATSAGIFIGGTGIYGRHGITATIDTGYHQLLDDLARQGIATVRYEKFDQAVSTPAEAEGAIDFQTLCHDAKRWLKWL